MKKEKTFLLFIMILLAISMCFPIVNADDISKNELNVSYYTHIQDIGWENEYMHKNGEMAGTTGKAKPIEAIRIKVNNLPEKIKLKYRAHVRDIGWQSWVNNGEMAGTTGCAKSIEAIQIKFEKTNDYIVRYQVHVRDIGWMDWVQDGEQAGTTGRGLPVEAIKIQILEKEGSIIYEAHVSDIGWMNSVSDGKQAGTTGRALPVEAVKINLEGYESLDIEYVAHVRNIGWLDWVEKGKQAGTTGRGLPMEAIIIRLKEYSDDYAIMYRVHVRDIGWMDWVTDGQMAGTTGMAKSIEALQIKVVKRTNKMKIDLCLDTPSDNKINEYATEKIKGWLMTSLDEINIDIKVDNKTASNISELKRTQRPDVLTAIKGYGGAEKNPTPGFELDIDFSKYYAGTHTISVVLTSKDGEILKEIKRKIKVEGYYGKSGLSYKGESRGTNLKYYKFGNGPNVFFATFAVHGFEDKWNNDAGELVAIAENFYNKLKDGSNNDIADKWTVYIFPEVNPDGRRYGWSHNGPGRTTLYSQAPANKGIDMNRCWEISGVAYTRFTQDRNYNGTAGFQAYEAKALRDFLLEHQSATAQTILVDLHGWTNQLIGDEDICMNYFYPRFTETDRSAIGRYGTGYLVNWARSTLRSSTRNAKSALIELPSSGINSHQDVLNQNLSNRYIDSVIEMLRGISVPVVSSGTKKMKARNEVDSNMKLSDILEISSETQYKIALAGMLKQGKPEEDEIDNLVSDKKQKNGIWVVERYRKQFEKLINEFTAQAYKIDQEGYLKVFEKNQNKNSYDLAIEKLMKGKKEYTIDMSGNYYSKDHMTGTIENNPFESMDEDQIYEYVENNNQIAIIITSNKNQILKNKEILDSLLDFTK